MSKVFADFAFKIWARLNLMFFLKLSFKNLQINK